MNAAAIARGNTFRFAVQSVITEKADTLDETPWSIVADADDQPIEDFLDSIAHDDAPPTDDLILLTDAKKAFDMIDRDFIRIVLIIVAGGDPDDEITECDHHGQLTEVGAFLRWIDILLNPDDTMCTAVLNYRREF